MPTFRWKGRTSGGQVIQGQLDAGDKEAVLVQLRTQGIALLSIEEGGSSGEPADPDQLTPRMAPDLAAEQRKRPRPFRGLLITAVFVAIAAAIGAFAPIRTITCERTATGSDCTIDERILGVYPWAHESLKNVTTIAVDTRWSEVTINKRKEQVAIGRIVLSDAEGTSIQTSRYDRADLGASNDAVESNVSAFLRDATPGQRVREWQASRLPLLLSGIALLLAALTGLLSILAFFEGPTKWIQQRTEKLAADARRRRSLRGRTGALR